MSSGTVSDAEPMSTKILGDIHDGSKSHTSITRREARYKIHDRMKRCQTEWKGAFLSR